MLFLGASHLFFETGSLTDWGLLVWSGWPANHRELSVSSVSISQRWDDGHMPLCLAFNSGCGNTITEQIKFFPQPDSMHCLLVFNR